MFLIVNTNASFFEPLGWSDLIKLYPSIFNLSSLLSREELRKVSDKHIMLKLCSVVYPCNNKTLRNSWAATSFKYQWQKFKDDHLGPGLISMSLQKYNKNSNGFFIFDFSCVWNLNAWKIPTLEGHKTPSISMDR